MTSLANSGIDARRAGAPTGVGIADGLEQRLQAIARELVAAQPRRSPVRSVDDLVMRRVAASVHLRRALYRLVDVAPVCSGPEDLGRHLAALLGDTAEDQEAGRTARGLRRSRSARAIAGTLLAVGVRHTGRRFITAGSPERAIHEIGRLWRHGAGCTLDLLGEAVVSSAEADRYTARCLRALDVLSQVSDGWPARGALDGDGVGPTPRVNLSVKVSALTARMHASAPWLGQRDAAPRLRAILRRARDLGAHVHLDMESLDTRETTLALALELLGEPEFRETPSAGVVIQAYLLDSEEVLARVLGELAGRRPPLAVRLVKGAYWDHERIEAETHGWAEPVSGEKAETDRRFERLTRSLLDARPGVRVAVASHNLRSISHALAYAERSPLARDGLEVQVLRGLGDELGDALLACDVRTRVYTPIGDIVAGMAYLVRRLLENTANDSFLVARGRHQELDSLLAPP